MRERFSPFTRTGDPLLALALAVLGECELFFPQLHSDFPGPRWLNAVLVVAIAAPVAFRRRAPLPALVVFWVPVQIWLDAVYNANSNLPLSPFLALLVLIYSAATFETGRRGRIVAGLIGAIYLSELVLLALGLKGWGNVVPGLVFIGLAYAIGLGLRRRHAEREVSIAEAVRSERSRIARELHDVIAHCVSVMVVQAGAGARLLPDRPDNAVESFDAIRETGNTALEELGRLLGLLREDTRGGAEAGPQPGLGRLDQLVAESRSAGLDVECSIDGARPPLPAGLDLAAYRVVQEALTNVRKHARVGQALVAVRYGAHQLEVTVVDDGDTPEPKRTGGHGLIGMQERVALYGGSLETGRREQRGFRVHAVFPLPQR